MAIEQVEGTKVFIFPHGSVKVRIQKDFDGMTTADAAADEVRRLWQETVEPLQAGFEAISAPYRKKQEEMERRYYNCKGDLIIRKEHAAGVKSGVEDAGIITAREY